MLRKKIKNRLFNFSNEEGVTLLELVIVLCIIGVLALAIAPAMHGIIRSYHMSTIVSESCQAARIGLNRMLNEIRMIPDSLDIVSASESSISFTDFDNNSVSFSRSGNTLLRNSYTLAENITGFMINYYDTSGTQVTTPTKAYQLDGFI